MPNPAIGRWVLVTGGNRGIGYDICKGLLQRGDNVVLASRDRTKGEEAAKSLSAFAKARCEVAELDVGSHQSIDQFIASLPGKDYSDLDVLVNNAGVLDNEWSEEVFNFTKQINFEAPVYLTYKMLPHLKQGGRIVMMSSGYGSLNQLESHYLAAVTKAQSIEELQAIAFTPASNLGPFGAPYTYKVSKAMLNAAVLIMTKQAQFSAKGISVNAVCPGWVRTGMGGEAASRSPEEGAASALAIVNHEDPCPTGTFSRDGKEIPW